MIPINLDFQMSDFRNEIKETSLPCIWLEILTENPGRFVLTNLVPWHQVPQVLQYRLIWLKSKFRVLRLQVLQLLTRRSKEMEELVHSSWSIDHHFLLTLHWLGNRINIPKYFLMWSQINVRSSGRLTGGRQIDFKVLSHQCQENIL